MKSAGFSFLTRDQADALRLIQSVPGTVPSEIDVHNKVPDPVRHYHAIDIATGHEKYVNGFKLHSYFLC